VVTFEAHVLATARRGDEARPFEEPNPDAEQRNMPMGATSVLED